MTRVEVVTASAGDQDAVLDILRSAGTAGPGTRVSTWGRDFPDVIGDLPSGLVRLARLDGRPVATFVLRWSDERVWGPDDGTAGYLHRLATHPDVAGRGIGAQLIAAAGGLTRERGRRWLRLDCDRDNERLRGYYEALGFAHAGDVDSLPRSTQPGYRAASRYQRAINGSRCWLHRQDRRPGPGIPGGPKLSEPPDSMSWRAVSRNDDVSGES